MSKRRKVLASLILAIASIVAIALWRAEILAEWILPRAAAWSGISPLRVHVVEIGASRLVLSEISVGEAAVPDLTVRRVAVDDPWAFFRGAKPAIRLEGVVVKASWIDGALSFGTFDSLLAGGGEAAAGRIDLPFQSLEIQDGELAFDAPGGVLSGLFDAQLVPSPAGGLAGSLDVIVRHEAGWLRGAAALDLDSQNDAVLTVELAEGEAAVTGFATRLGHGNIFISLPSQGAPRGTANIAIDRLAIAGRSFAGLTLDGGIDGDALRVALTGGEATPGLAIAVQAAVSDLRSDDGTVIVEARLQLGGLERDPAGGTLPYGMIIGGSAQFSLESSVGALRAVARGDDSTITPRLDLDLTMRADATPYGALQAAVDTELVATYSGQRLRLTTGNRMVLSLTGTPPGLDGVTSMEPTTITLSVPSAKAIPFAIDADLAHGIADATVDIAYSLAASEQGEITGVLSGNAAMGILPFDLRRWRVIDATMAGGPITVAGHRISVESARLFGTGSRQSMDINADLRAGYDGQPVPGLSITGGSLAFAGDVAWQDGNVSIAPKGCLALAAGGIRWQPHGIRAGPLDLCLEADTKPLIVWPFKDGLDSPGRVAGSLRLVAPVDLRATPPGSEGPISTRVTRFRAMANGTPEDLKGRVGVAATRIAADQSDFRIRNGSITGAGQFSLADGTATLVAADCLTVKFGEFSAHGVSLTKPAEFCLKGGKDALLTMRMRGEQSARAAIMMLPAQVFAQLGTGETQTDLEGTLPAFDVDATWRAAESSWSVEGAVDGGDILVADRRLGVSDVSVRMSAGGASSIDHAEVKLIGLTLSDRAPAPAFATLDMSGSAFLVENALRFAASIGDRGGLLALSAEGEHDVADGKGRATFGMPTVTFGPGRQPQEVVPLLRGIVTSVQGSLDLAGEAAWDGDTHASTMTVSLNGGAVNTQVAEISGIEARAQFDSVWPPSTPPGQTLSIGNADVGVPLNDIQVRFQVLPEGAVLVERAAWPWMDGTIMASNVVLDPSKDRHAMVLEVDGVRVERILDMIDLDDLAGTGRLRGRIPVEVIDGTPYIREGRLATDGNGVLSYSSESVDAALRSGGQGGALLADALKDFRYKSLVMEIDGATTGDVTARVSLAGSNPDLYDNYPIELNTSFEGNLGQIMRGARATYAIPDGIRQQLEGSP